MLSSLTVRPAASLRLASASTWAWLRSSSVFLSVVLVVASSAFVPSSSLVVLRRVPVVVTSSLLVEVSVSRVVVMTCLTWTKR